MYKIVRYYFSAGIKHRTIATSLTLDEAKLWCQNPNTSSRTCASKTGKARTRKLGPWFDGFAKM